MPTYIKEDFEMKPENETTKRIYQPATAVIVRFQAEDLLTVSVGGDNGINLPLDPL